MAIDEHWLYLLDRNGIMHIVWLHKFYDENFITRINSFGKIITFDLYQERAMIIVNDKGTSYIHRYKMYEYDYKFYFVELIVPHFIINASVGHSHYFLFTKDNKIVSKGNNEFGQLGTGDESLINKEGYFVDAKCGEQHTIFVSKYGEFYACGYNKQKRLGFENICNHCMPSLMEIR